MYKYICIYISIYREQIKLTQVSNYLFHVYTFIRLTKYTIFIEYIEYLLVIEVTRTFDLS